MSHINGHLDPAFTRYRNPDEIFKLAIAKGTLSEDESCENYVGYYMYMGEAAEGGSMFKNIITRFYLPAVKL
jgi:hypothetical protein